MRVAAIVVTAGMLLVAGSAAPTTAGTVERDGEIRRPVERLDPRVEACILPVVYRGGQLELCPGGRTPELGVVPVQPPSADR